MSDPESRRALEQRFRDALEARQAEYNQAKELVRRAEERGRGGLPEPDGSQAYRNALARESHALLRYRKALSAFMTVVLQGKDPGSGDDV